MNRTGKLFLAISSLFFLRTQAQSFHWESPIDPVNQNGYYRILLNPEITSGLSTGFPDMRLYDQDSLETPYLVYKDEAHQGVDRFVTYQIVDKHLVRGCCSYIKVKNSTGNPIDHIVLEVNNAETSRSMTLSGSYDGSSWYAVRDHFTVESFNTLVKGERKTTSLIRFDFPLTDYKLYKFEFDDWWHWWWHDNDYHYPVFVVRAGYTEPTFIPEECLTVQKPILTQHDSVKKKQTYLKISFPDSQYVDHLRFYLHTKKAGKDYYRSAFLYELQSVTNNGKTETDQYPITRTVFSSLNDNEINLGRKRVKELLLIIENGDDQALVVDSVAGFQVKHYIVAELEKGSSYILRFGDRQLSTPDYDLKYFKEKIPAAPTIIYCGKRKDIAAQKVTVEVMKKIATAAQKAKVESYSVFKDKRFIWGAIAAVILLLGFMTMKMLKEMKKEE
jgi:hypothetical protein